MPSIQLPSVTALLLAGVALAADTSPGAQPAGTNAPAPASPSTPAAVAPTKPAAAAPTVAQVKAPTAEQLKANRCNASADGKALEGDARKRYVADCLKAP